MKIEKYFFVAAEQLAADHVSASNIGLLARMLKLEGEQSADAAIVAAAKKDHDAKVAAAKAKKLADPDSAESQLAVAQAELAALKGQ